MNAPTPVSVPDWLREGDIVGIGRIPAGSNATFVVAIDSPEGQRLAVYKPRKGERPLWDFPSGTLYRREVATYVVAEALGWYLIPPTIVRDGPHGIGSLQVYCEPNKQVGFRHIRKRRRSELMRLAVFDIVTNNADRKYEHCLLAEDGALYGIDNGLTFHTEFKNRTVLADFAGQPIDSQMVNDLASLTSESDRRAALDHGLAPLLDDDEIRELYHRARMVSETGILPSPIPHWEMYYLMVE